MVFFRVVCRSGIRNLASRPLTAMRPTRRAIAAASYRFDHAQYKFRMKGASTERARCREHPRTDRSGNAGGENNIIVQARRLLLRRGTEPHPPTTPPRRAGP